MRKEWVVMVGMTCLCVFGIIPSASAQIIVNFDTYFTDPVLSTMGYSLTSDNDGDGIPDATWDALISAILADTGQPTYGVVSAAWTANLASLVPVHDALVTGGYPETTATALQSIWAAGLTCVGYGYVLAALTDFGLEALMPASPDISAGPIVGPNGNADGDAFSNVEEYGAAGGDRAQFLTNALTPGGFTITTDPQGGNIFVGQSWTFTVAVANGVPPFLYQWKKGTTAVGTNTASYTITNAQLSDAGSYTCTVSDQEWAMVTSNPVILNVYDAGSLPAAGIYGLIALVMLCLGAGVIVLRRVAHR